MPYVVMYFVALQNYCWLIIVFDSFNPLFSFSLRKNTFVSLGTVLKKPEFLVPSRDVQNVFAAVCKRRHRLQ